MQNNNQHCAGLRALLSGSPFPACTSAPQQVSLIRLSWDLKMHHVSLILISRYPILQRHVSPKTAVYNAPAVEPHFAPCMSDML